MNDSTVSQAPYPELREVRFEYSPHLPRILQHVNATLLVSTYQAGKLGVVGVHDGKLTFQFVNFEKAMGVAVGTGRRIAVGARRSVQFLDAAPDLAAAVEPTGTHDGCWLARSSHHTGNVHIHETAWGTDRLRDDSRSCDDAKSDSSPVPHPSSHQTLWFVNTLFSCLSTLDDAYSFVPRWRPPFVSELAAQDRCHLNGLAMDGGRPRYVTCHGDQNEAGGWRATKATGGVIVDVESGETVARGFAMPHSPRIHDSRLWVLNSGHGSIESVDPATGRHEAVETMPGFTRGLCFAGQFAFVGLSKIRETSVFGGMPIEAQRDNLRAGVAVVDLVSGQTVAALQFHSGVDEIFSVEVLPGVTNPAFRGPEADRDGTQDIWLVPPEGTMPSLNRKPQACAPENTATVSGSAQAGGLRLRDTDEVTSAIEMLAFGRARLLPSRRFGGKHGSAGASPSQDTVGVISDATLNNEASYVSGQSTQSANPRDMFRRALALQRDGRLAESLSLMKQAATLAPNRAGIRTELGNLYQQLGDQHSALACYRSAVRTDPDFVPARQNLGYLLFNHGYADEAVEQYEYLTRLDSSPLNRLLAAGVLPVIYDSEDDAARWRTRLTTGIRQIANSGDTIDTESSLVPTSFFPAYQGRNDVEIARDLGTIFVGPTLVEKSQAMASELHGLSANAVACDFDPADSAQPAEGRIRVGFLSAYFRDHTIGRLNIGRIEHLSRDRFEVVVLSVGNHKDAMANRFRAAADRFVTLPRNLTGARTAVVEQDLDVLVFTDVGMDALSYTLAFSRMAPVQCATWGHPSTTGSPTVDYFLSSELLETHDADRHYTEQLIRLPNLGTYYERPVPEQVLESGAASSHDSNGSSLAAVRRAAASGFPLDAERHIYLCPQTLFKFHPDFDEVLAGILDRDPQGQLVLIEGRVPNWTERLRQRFERTLPGGCERVTFLPSQPNDRFLQLLGIADVMLDPLHFGGGNTSYEALAVGTPVVTFPSEFLRGRITAALYSKMGLDDCVVGSPEEYVDVAVRIATDAEYGHTLRRRIEGLSPVLFEDLNEIRELEESLQEITGRARCLATAGTA